MISVIPGTSEFCSITFLLMTLAWPYVHTSPSILLDALNPIANFKYPHGPVQEIINGNYYDLINAVKFIKPGGTLFGDDYGDKKPNVKKAVDKFIADTGYEFNNFHLDQFEVKI